MLLSFSVAYICYLLERERMRKQRRVRRVTSQSCSLLALANDGSVRQKRIAAWSTADSCGPTFQLQTHYSWIKFETLFDVVEVRHCTPSK
jgi:hypothetical protein